VNPDRARESLMSELADLDERLAAARADRAESSADSVSREGAPGQHPGDYGSEVTTTMEAALSLHTVEEQRRRVVEALDRLDEGDYGQCAVCGREIDDERLEARPEAVTCREHADSRIVM
jgi:RNA polymerase-binding transcription factor DksA